MTQGASLPGKKTWQNLYKSTLDLIFQECSQSKLVITADCAIDLMEELFAKMIERDKQSNAEPRASRLNFVALRCEAHHYAVDVFYKTYYGRKRGAASLSLEYLDRLLTLRRQGRNESQIASSLGQRKDTIRKQLQLAQSVWHEKVRKIEELRTRKT